jgi:hypothetical protein
VKIDLNGETENEIARMLFTPCMIQDSLLEAVLEAAGIPASSIGVLLHAPASGTAQVSNTE